MSDDLERRLREDRALRSSARALLSADVANLRSSLSGRSISSRIFDRIGEGASGVFEEAREAADNHRGVFATLIAAIVLWFARNPIKGLFGHDDGDHDDDVHEFDDDVDLERDRRLRR